MFRQEFELSATCKKVQTIFTRFKKKFPAVWEVWGELFECMYNNGQEHCEDIGWSLWLYIDEQFGTHYMAVVLTDEAQKL